MTSATDTSSESKRSPEIGVSFERSGATVVLTLDRPAKLNAINSGMKAAIANEIPKVARDPQVYAVVLQSATSRIFSAGGDIREFYDLAQVSPEAAAAECAREYSLIWLLECFSKPTIALIDGPVMGTGAGVVQATTHHVAGAGYRFQMPETLIGFFPDNGVCWHLARLPHEIGTWLALSGASIGREDAYWLGLVTHCIEAARFGEIKAAIARAEPIDIVLDGLHVAPGEPPLKSLSGVIERCFSAGTVGEILRRLGEENSERGWCESAVATLRARSPLALEATLQHVRRARHLDLRQTLALDYRLAARLVVAHDFLEGVQARIIEKNREPRWAPAALTDLGQRQVERLFDPLGAGELMLPTRAEMQAMRV